MSQIERGGWSGSNPCAGQLVFVATAARASVVGPGGGVRSAMARAAQLLALDPPDPVTARRPSVQGSLRAASRRRTRRYAERQLVAS